MTKYVREPVDLKYAKVGKSEGQSEASLVVCFAPVGEQEARGWRRWRLTQSTVHLPLAPGPISDFLDVAGVLSLDQVEGARVDAFTVAGSPYVVVGFGATGDDGPRMFWR